MRRAILALPLASLACSSPQGPPVDAIAAAEAELGIDLEESWVETNGIRLHVVEAGPRDGAPVLLLHGLPEFWWGWHRQMGALARAGFRVIAPDQRGHNASDKPEEIAAYRDVEMMRDALGLIDALGYQRVFVAGHNAGAGVAWYLAIEHPERVERLAVFGIGHPSAFQEMLRTSETPLFARVFYGALAGLLRTELPEVLARQGDWAVLSALLRSLSEGTAFSEDELAYYRQAWERDSAFHYSMNWYRADFAYAGQRPYTRDVRVEPPVLVVVLGGDSTVPQEPARQSARFCAKAEIVELAGASHWVLHERPEVASDLLVDFFAAP